MVACSPAEAEGAEAVPVEGRAALGSNVDGDAAGGVGRAGSGVEGEFGPVWFGFHMVAIVSFPFCVNSRSLPGSSLVGLHACQLQPVFLEHVAVSVAGRIVRMWFLLGENPRKCVVKVWGTYSKPRSRGPFEHDTTPGAIPGTGGLCKTWAKTSDYEGSKAVACRSAEKEKQHIGAPWTPPPHIMQNQRLNRLTVYIQLHFCIYKICLYIYFQVNPNLLSIA